MKKAVEYIVIAAIVVASCIWVYNSTQNAISSGYYGNGVGNER